MNFEKLLNKRLSLAILPTKIEKCTFNGSSFTIKRDDNTGVLTSGNKIRKLEYLLYDAQQYNSDVIITCGGDQSNHARATTAAAKALGMKVKLFLWGKKQTYPQGNLLINQFLGADISYISKKEFLNVDSLMEAERTNLRKKGVNAYIIPEGGSSVLGVLGYVQAVREMLEQNQLSGIKGFCIAAGSGGTAAGLLLANSIFRLKMDVYAVNVLYSPKVINNKIIKSIAAALSQFNTSVPVDLTRLSIIDGYSQEGYKKISSSKVKIIRDFAHQTGIILDPTYTGKAFCAYNDHFLKNNKKTPVMFIHTGGVFGIFSHNSEYAS